MEPKKHAVHGSSLGPWPRYGDACLQTLGVPQVEAGLVLDKANYISHQFVQKSRKKVIHVVQMFVSDLGCAVFDTGCFSWFYWFD